MQKGYGMEKQEAINLMKLWRASVEMNGADSEHLDAFDMAIEALSEPSRQGQRDDLISRQDAIDALIERDPNCGIDSAEVIKDLPSAQPERNKGKWVRITQGAMPEQYICPFCHRTVEAYGVEELLSIRYPYCHCGADMRGEEE